MKMIMKAALLGILTVVLIVIVSDLKLIKDSAPEKSWSAKTNHEKGAWIEYVRTH